jgi:hypothetical protein
MESFFPTALVVCVALFIVFVVALLSTTPKQTQERSYVHHTSCLDVEKLIEETPEIILCAKSFKNLENREQLLNSAKHLAERVLITDIQLHVKYVVTQKDFIEFDLEINDFSYTKKPDRYSELTINFLKSGLMSKADRSFILANAYLMSLAEIKESYTTENFLKTVEEETKIERGEKCLK